jgi:hypothetical protein
MDRKLGQWAVAYAAGAWLVMQIVDVLGDRWSLSMIIQRSIDVGLVVGFVGVLVLAWYHGEQGRQRVSGPELLILATLFFLGALGVRVLVSAQSASPSAKVSARSSCCRRSATQRRAFTTSTVGDDPLAVG